jgi:biuret amidohydrolase
MPQRPLITGQPVLIVVDLQVEGYDTTGPIPIMDGYREVVENCARLIGSARSHSVPVIFIQEVHTRTHIDFGRELDGDEDVHDLEDDPSTSLVPEAQPLPDEYLVRKRRYSAFFGTDLDILLKGLHAQTLVLCGGLTNVCVQYTFVDAHQLDYYVRVARDAVIGSSKPAHHAALEAMEYFQTGALRSTDALIQAFKACTDRSRPPVNQASPPARGTAG